MRVAYLGNFGVDFSTESHVAQALEANGHQVQRIQEGQTPARDVAQLAVGAALFLWTQTYSLAVQGGDIDARLDMLEELRALGVPSTGFHLDRWWGLNREHQVRDEPFFRCDLVCTADGGHEEQWRDAGVNHHWLPPGVSEFECEPGRADHRYNSELAFIGSWQPGQYHHEWTHRPELVRWLRLTYRGRIRFWPKPGHHAVRGQALRDLYASTKINVGDSCLVGDASRYWSDRIPETLGRGGFLLHPYVEGIEEHFTDGKHLRLWPAGDWGELSRLIDHYLEHDDERRAIAEQGRRHVLEHHTYSVRMRQLVALL